MNNSFIPLDIALDYPVEWEFWRVLRDLIQNFYDSIGYHNFYKEFEYHYEYEENGELSLTLRTQNHPFSYEWLTFFGGSTKTGKSRYIGNYGEGFKICALVLTRMGVPFTMESQNWCITPCTYRQNVDGRQIPMLGYDMSYRVDDHFTTLTVNHIPSEYRSDIEEALLNFFYPENSLFGEKIADTKDYAIYERSDQKAPYYGDLTDDIQGILYYKYLARGILPFRLIILAKTQKYDGLNKRDRNCFLTCQVMNVMYCVAQTMSPSDSYDLLIRLERYWSELPKPERQSYLDLTSWYYVICQLVRNISANADLCHSFQEQYHNLLWLDRMSSDIIKNRKIKAAKEWHRALDHKGRIVNPIFRLLGVPCLIDLYQADQEQTLFIHPSQTQTAMGRLLEAAYHTVVPDTYISGSETPALMISDNYHGSPMAFCRRRYEKRIRGQCYKKYQVETILMESGDFANNKFHESFVKYSGLRFHEFCTDQSSTMAALLTMLGGWMFDHREQMERMNRKWKELADADRKIESGHDLPG